MVQLCRIHHASGADSTCWKPGWFLDMGDHHEQHATQIICTDFWIKVHLSDQNIFNQKWLFVGDVRILRSHCSFKPRGRKNVWKWTFAWELLKQENIRRWREGKTKIYPLEGINPSYSKSSVHSLESLLQVRQYVDIKWPKVQYTKYIWKKLSSPTEVYIFITV